MYLNLLDFNVRNKYWQPCISIDSESIDSTNCESKIFKEKHFFTLNMQTVFFLCVCICMCVRTHTQECQWLNQGIHTGLYPWHFLFFILKHLCP